MKNDEPRMIQNFNLLKKFRQEVKQENPELTEMQQQQRAMMKMQEHMMKNGPPAFSKPPPAQQKIVQLQMLGHIKTQFQS